MFHTISSLSHVTPDSLKSFYAEGQSDAQAKRATIFLTTEASDSSDTKKSEEIKNELSSVRDLFPHEIYSALEKLISQKEAVSRKDIVLDGAIAPVMVCKIQKADHTHEMHKVLRKLYKKLKSHSITHAQFYLPGTHEPGFIEQVIKRFDLEDYAFDRYKTTGLDRNPDATKDDDKPDFKPVSWTLFVDDSYEIDSVSLRARALSQATLTARDLVNEPSNVLTPRELATRAQNLASKYGFEIEVHGSDWIVEQGLHAYWSVAKGSDEEPQFIVMRYFNAPENDEVLGLIGKGMCYDSGGYAIKPASSMVEMHTDMGGSAAVIGAISTLAALKAPVNVVAIVAACENMISGHAYKNGDIIPSLSGKYIEVGNTDAEGRLTLADALTYAWKKEGATKLVDIATLTGAAIVALGYHYTAVLSDTPDMWSNLEQASAICGDKVWQLPCDDEYAAQNRSDVADIKNVGTGGPGGAGTITAGMFVRTFAGERPFMHLDIAATSWLKSDGEFYPQGASGVGAELLALYVLEEFCPKKNERSQKA